MACSHTFKKKWWYTHCHIENDCQEHLKLKFQSITSKCTKIWNCKPVNSTKNYYCNHLHLTKAEVAFILVCMTQSLTNSRNMGAICKQNVYISLCLSLIHSLNLCFISWQFETLTPSHSQPFVAMQVWHVWTRGHHSFGVDPETSSPGHESDLVMPENERKILDLYSFAKVFWFFNFSNS